MLLQAYGRSTYNSVYKYVVASETSKGHSVRM